MKYYGVDILVGMSVDITDRTFLEKYGDRLLDWFAQKAMSFMLTIIFIYIGLKFISFLVKIIKKSFDKTTINISVSGFLLSLIKVFLIGILFYF